MASQYSAAVSLYQVTTTHFLNTLGPAHPDTIRARNELASAYCLAKRYADAITVHKEILAQLTRTPGPEYPDTIEAHDELVWPDQVAGQYTDAITLDEELLTDIIPIIPVLGEDHPLTTTVRENLEAARRELEQQEEDSANEEREQED
jgi:hypothetical protein avisC_02045